MKMTTKLYIYALTQRNGQTYDLCYIDKTIKLFIVSCNTFMETGFADSNGVEFQIEQIRSMHANQRNYSEVIYYLGSRLTENITYGEESCSRSK